MSNGSRTGPGPSLSYESEWLLPINACSMAMHKKGKVTQPHILFQFLCTWFWRGLHAPPISKDYTRMQRNHQVEGFKKVGTVLSSVHWTQKQCYEYIQQLKYSKLGIWVQASTEEKELLFLLIVNASKDNQGKWRISKAYIMHMDPDFFSELKISHWDKAEACCLPEGI